MLLKQILSLAFTFVFILNIKAQDLSEQAINFLNTLSPELRSRATFTLDDQERYNIQFVPIERKGPTFHDFNEEQKSAALKLLRSSLSQQGYNKSTEIMELEKVLFVVENNQWKWPDGTPVRDPLNYHILIFGQPSEDAFWGWRFEGHHLSLSFSTADNQIVASTPSFWGSNPAKVNVEGFDNKEVLKSEQDLGFKLVNSLSPDQLSIAKFSDTAPRDIFTGNDREAHNLEPKGLSYTDLNDDQKAIFMKLLNVYIDNYESGFAESFRKKIENAGLEHLSFAWAGSLEPGKGHYYRIQGPVLLIEYDNTQNNANHIHSVVRDLTNDFGEDILKAHYHHDH
jgi:hypothetical protein